MSSARGSKRSNDENTAGESTKRSRIEKSIQKNTDISKAVDVDPDRDGSVMVIPGEFGITIPVIVYNWLMEAQVCNTLPESWSVWYPFSNPPVARRRSSGKELVVPQSCIFSSMLGHFPALSVPKFSTLSYHHSSKPSRTMGQG